MRRPKNLYLDPEAIEHGEEYGRRHRTNLSQLVGDFLRSLPLETATPPSLSPAVQRLVGAAVPKKPGKHAPTAADYRTHLKKKFGR